MHDPRVFPEGEKLNFEFILFEQLFSTVSRVIYLIFSVIIYIIRYVRKFCDHLIV